MIEVNSKNYYSRQVDKEYMSCSLYDSYLKCEAETHAYINGEWERDTKSLALLQGQYFHALMESESAAKEFLEENAMYVCKYKNPEKGVLADFIKIEELAKFALQDELFHSAIYKPTGLVEHIMVGEIFGVPWRIRMDKYFPNKNLIFDWKTAKDFENVWDSESRKYVTFIEKYGYIRRAKIYTDIVIQNGGSERTQFWIGVVTKEKTPNKELINLTESPNCDEHQYEMIKVNRRLERIMDIRNGNVEPKRCGKCDYCKKTKKITSVIPWTAFLNDGDLEFYE